MGELIQLHKYKKMISTRKRTILKKLKEIENIMIRYGIVPYILDVKLAQQVVRRIE